MKTSKRILSLLLSVIMVLGVCAAVPVNSSAVEVTLYGDANCDDVVNMADCVLIIQCLANPDRYGLRGSDSTAMTLQGYYNADVDVSTLGLTVDDAVKIQEYLLEKVMNLNPNAKGIGSRAPVSGENSDISFSFVDDNGNDQVKLASGQGKIIMVDVNINAGSNPVSALDVQFAVTKGIIISDIIESANAFNGVIVSDNLDKLRANYLCLDGDKPMQAANGESAFMLEVEVPSNTADGIYYVDFSQCNVFKDNTSFNYNASKTPLKIVVGSGGTDAVNEVEDLINAIGTVTYTAECKARIDAARQAYNSLNTEQQTQVINYGILLQAEVTYAELEVNALNPVEISDYAELKAFAGRVNSGETGLNAILTADITATDKEWVPIGNASNQYTGTFDGGGHTVKNLSNAELTETIGCNGLFGLIGSGGKVMNAGIINADFIETYESGGIAGGNNGTVENCFVTGKLSISSNNMAGGVVGWNFGTVSGCYNSGSGNITGGQNTDAGGVVGRNSEGTIENCYNSGTATISGDSKVGGIVGCNNGGTVSGCYNSGSGSITGNYNAGGVVGDNIGTVENCYNSGSGNISGNSNAGGVVGLNTGSDEKLALVKNCYYYGSGDIKGSKAAGVVGYNPSNGTVENSFYCSDLNSIGTCISSGLGTSSNVDGLSKEDFQNPEKFGGYDFDNVWVMGSQRPKLKWANDKGLDSDKGDIIEYGTYPQSEVKDADTCAALNAMLKDDGWISYGYYSGDGTYYNGSMQDGEWMKYQDIELDGTKYRAVTFDSLRPAYTDLTGSPACSYQDNNGYLTGNVYWFVFEPVKWRVLDPDEGLILCETLIDSQPFNNYIILNGEDYYGDEGSDTHSIYASDYENSSIKEWLNNDFYNTALSDAQKPLFESDSGSPETKDEVFLLSEEEVLNENYGFNTRYYERDSAKAAKGSDYAKCQGLRVVETEGTYYGFSFWYLSTAGSDSGHIYIVNNDGTLSSNQGSESTFIGIRPAIKLIRKTPVVSAPSLLLDILPVDPVYGNEVKVTATLPEDAQGTVTFTLTGKNNNYSFDPVDVSGGKAEITEKFNADDYTVTASYSGDDKYNEVTAETDISVDKATPELTVTILPENPTTADELTITAKVSGNATFSNSYGEERGATLFIDDKSIATLTSNTNEVTFTVPGLDAGEHTIKVVYNGDKNHYACNGEEIKINVGKAEPEITIGLNDADYGETIDVTVTISGGDATGTITFNGNQYEVVNGQTAFSFTPTVTGRQSITVEYSGDEKYNSGAANKDFTVNPVNCPLTINYVYAEGGEAHEPYTGEVEIFKEYSVTSPEITGYTPDPAVVEGTMGDDDINGKTVTVTYTVNTYKLTWVIDSENYKNETVTFGSEITAPEVDEKEGYTFAWVDEIPATMPAENVTINGGYTAITYTATFVDENGKTVDTRDYTVETESITEPAVPEKAGYDGRWEEYTLKIGGITVKPVYDNITSIAIKDFEENSETGYKEDKTFTAEADNLPEGAEIHWFVDGEDAGTGSSYTVEDPTEDYTVQAKVIDKDGNVLAESETAKVHVKNGFFDRLKAFFAELIEKILGKAIADLLSSVC